MNIIIGAGIGGLSTAIRLAAAGQKVAIYEQNTAVGGKMSQITAAGYRWDTGPSVITMRHVFEELFASAGRQLEDYLTLLPIEPLTRYFFQDGTVLDVSRDMATTLAHIGRLNPRDEAGYLRYLAYAAEIHRITGPVFIYDQPPTPASFLRVPVRDMLKVDAWRTMSGAINSFVQTPHLRQLLGRFATYVGASPYAAPATLNVIADVELNGGVWYPQGGIYAIAQAMAKLAEELGVEIHLNAGVERVVVGENGRATGIRVGGEFVPAQTVISNVDVTTTYKYLLPATPPIFKRLQKLETAEPSCSGLILLLGLEGQTPQLAHHNILFARDYPAEFAAIFGRGEMPADPTIYIAITSKTDPSHAPAGGENWFVLLNAPATGPNWDWAARLPDYKAQIYELLAQVWGIDIKPRLRHEQVLTPHDLFRLNGAHRGALYGPSSNSMWAAFRRPHNRCREVAGLYFVGGTTHPGGGVPMVTLSGKVVAEMVLADNANNYP